MPFTLFNARLVDAAGEVESGALTVDGAQIGALGASPGAESGIDLSGAIVTPGFIDVHTHGGGGFNLHTPDADEIRGYARWAPATGTTAFLAGVVGVPQGLPDAEIAAVVQAAAQPGSGAEVLGIHLEGPFINPVRRGAHDPAWLRLPGAAEAEQILALSQGYLKLITIAPELPGAAAMIERLVAAGVTVSIGHTDADYEQAQAAIPLGIRHATHCFNAMRPLLHRAPGPLGAICAAEQVLGELIADGVHVHPAVAQVLIHALGPERVVVVTDALPVAGQPAVPFTFGGQPAHVEGGVARLADGTITGSVLTMDQGLRNVYAFGGVPLAAAVGMLTHNPARSAGVTTRKGLLQPGYDADLLIFDGELQLQATFCRGKLAFATPLWQARLGAAGLAPPA
jgi:N-acetylglucosamine-6-phosphate deacetylase